MTSGAFSLSWILQGLFAIFAGRLTDRLGPRVVLTLCGLLSGLGYLLMSRVGGVWQIYLFYGVFIGSGMGAAWVPITSTVTRWFSKRAGIMVGIVLAGAATGTLIVPPVANWLISIYDWRLAYAILGGVVLVGVILAAQLVRRSPTQVSQKTYGENEGKKPASKLDAESFSLKEAVYTRQFWMAFVMLFCGSSCIFPIMVHIAPHATDLGFSSATAANLIATIGLLSIPGRIALGHLADRIGDRSVLMIGFVLMVAALLMLVFGGEVLVLYLASAIIGFSWGTGVVVPSLTAKLFGLYSLGSILGAITFGFTIGAGFSPLIAGYIFDVTDSYQGAFLLFAAVGIIGLILAAVLRPTTKTGL